MVERQWIMDVGRLFIRAASRLNTTEATISRGESMFNTIIDKYNNSERTKEHKLECLKGIHGFII